jgi:hypothetical protein
MRLNNRLTELYCLKLIKEGRLEEAKYIESLRPRTIIIGDEEPEIDPNYSIISQYDVNKFWGDDAKLPIKVILPDDE